MGLRPPPSSDVLGEALEQLAAHHDPVVQSYARERLQQRQAQLSSGFLNGVIDLIIRRPSRDGTQHWVVLDWKTNRLVRPINDLMAAKDYWLQAQLYRQAVQRWLHWRLGEQTPVRIDAVMLFTRSGEGPGCWMRRGNHERSQSLPAGCCPTPEPGPSRGAGGSQRRATTARTLAALPTPGP